MLGDFLDFIDDTLIDRFFQPICNAIRHIFGYSKRIPITLMKMIAITGSAPLCVVFITIGSPLNVFGVFIFLWILVQIKSIITLLNDEKRDQELPGGCLNSILDGYRVRGRNERKVAFVLSLSLIFFMMFPALQVPGINYVINFYLLSIIANLCDGFFRACIDTPKGKTAITKVKEYLLA